jgi:hypothetical protein
VVAAGSFFPTCGLIVGACGSGEEPGALAQYAPSGVKNVDGGSCLRTSPPEGPASSSGFAQEPKKHQKHVKQQHHNVAHHHHKTHHHHHHAKPKEPEKKM